MLGGGGPRGKGVGLSEGPEPPALFGWGGDGVEVEAWGTKHFIFICGTSGVLFVGMPFGSGLFVVEVSAGDQESVAGEERVKGDGWIKTEEDGEGRW